MISNLILLQLKKNIKIKLSFYLLEKNKIKTTEYRLFRQPTMHRNMNLNQFLKLQLKQKKKVYSRNSMNRTSSNKWNLNLVLPEENNKNKTMAWKMKVIFSILPKKLLKKSLYVTRGRNNLNKLRRSELIIYNLYLNLYNSIILLF